MKLKIILLVLVLLIILLAGLNFVVLSKTDNYCPFEAKNCGEFKKVKVDETRVAYGYVSKQDNANILSPISGKIKLGTLYDKKSKEWFKTIEITGELGTVVVVSNSNPLVSTGQNIIKGQNVGTLEKNKPVGILNIRGFIPDIVVITSKSK